MITSGGKEVYLIGDVRDVLRELHCDPAWEGTCIGISSRTDEPSWARELLQKFQIDHGSGVVTLDDLFDGPREIAKDSKEAHFRRIAESTGQPMECILFFDNEAGNCFEVAKLGVTVAYCPDGVTNDVWNNAIANFPSEPGQIIGY